MDAQQFQPCVFPLPGSHFPSWNAAQFPQKGTSQLKQPGFGSVPFCHWERISHGRARNRTEIFPIPGLNTLPILSSVPQALIPLYLKAMIPLHCLMEAPWLVQRGFQSTNPTPLADLSIVPKPWGMFRTVIPGSPWVGLFLPRTPSLPPPVRDTSLPCSTRVPIPHPWARKWY